MPPLAILDAVQSWDAATLAIAGAVLTVVVLVASYFMAVAWRRWKDGKRRRASAARGLAPAAPPPPGATGTRFTARALAAKLPRAKAPGAPSGGAPAAPRAEPKLPKLGLPRLGRAKKPPAGGS